MTTIALLRHIDNSVRLLSKSISPDGHPNSPTYGHLKLLHLN